MTSQRRRAHEHLPHVVYIMRDAAGDVIYVGSTSNFKQRKAAHIHQKPWAYHIDSWTVSKEMTWEEALAVEEDLIADLSPRFNRQRSTGRRWIDHGIREQVDDFTPEQVAEMNARAAAILEHLPLHAVAT